MDNKLTKKQKEFADEYLKTGNATKAALKTYNVKDERVAASVGSENLRKPDIIQYFKDNASIAADTIMNLIEDEKTPTPVKLNACKDVLDRAGYKPTDKLEHSGVIDTGVVILPERKK